MRSSRIAVVTALAVLLGTSIIVGDVTGLPLPVRNRDYRDEGRPDPREVELGRLLFFDKILSGNRNISCATCHHPLTATGDGLSLSVGEGGSGLGAARTTGAGDAAIVERVPRNAPALFNLGAREFSRMFHDGRVEADSSHRSGYRSPAGDALPAGLDSVLAVQAMFPVTSLHEMAGQAGENEIADVAADERRSGPGGVWDLLARRLRQNTEYADLFQAVFDDVRSADQITFVHAANAIAAFEAAAFRSDRSPFDRYLRGERRAMSRSARSGMRLFYGEAGCSSCHAGVFQTDHRFYAIAMPQIGPGKGDGADGREDFGRGRISGEAEDRYRFRTPSLRNVAMTGPWGHAGSYDRLSDVILHHLRPGRSLNDYDPARAVLPSRPDLDRIDHAIPGDPLRVAALVDACELPATDADRRELADLLEFMWALTDPNAENLGVLIPDRVPSGLPVAD